MLAIEEGSSLGVPCCSVPPQVRERRLTRLPDAHMYVGRTPLSLEDIRAWNALQEQGSMVSRCSGCTAGEHVQCFAACGCAAAVGVKQLCSCLLLHCPPPDPSVLQHYELHRNDCRHYINCLVKYTTGREQAASACLAAQWQRARELGTYGLATSVVRLTQFFTDLANWGKVQVRQPGCSARVRGWLGLLGLGTLLTLHACYVTAGVAAG